jgi:broad specificity phosphatase PhoE
MGRLIAGLIRHGDYQQLANTPSAHQPFPLNERGRAQAREAVLRLREDLRREGWALHPCLDSSCLQRAWQTACLIVEGLRKGLPEAGGEAVLELSVESHAALAERGLGSAANLTLTQIEEVLLDDQRFQPPPRDWKANSHYRLPLQGAESLLEAGARVAAHLRERMGQLPRRADRDTLKLFVGHGAAFRHAAFHLGVLAFDEIARVSMYHARPVYLEWLPDGSWRHLSGAWKPRGRHHEPLD